MSSSQSTSPSVFLTRSKFFLVTTSIKLSLEEEVAVWATHSSQSQSIVGGNNYRSGTETSLHEAENVTKQWIWRSCQSDRSDAALCLWF